MDQAIILQMAQQVQQASVMNLFSAKSNGKADDGGKFQQLLDNAVQHQEPKAAEQPEQPGQAPKSRESDDGQAEWVPERPRLKYTGTEPMWFQPLIDPVIATEEISLEPVVAEVAEEAAQPVAAIGPNVAPLVNPRLIEPGEGFPLADFSGLPEAEEEEAPDPLQDKVIASVAVERETGTATMYPILVDPVGDDRFDRLIHEARDQLLRAVGMTNGDEDRETDEVTFSDLSDKPELTALSTGEIPTVEKPEDATDIAMLRVVRQREAKPAEERADQTPFQQVESLPSREIEQPQPPQQAPVFRAPQMEQIRAAVAESLQDGRMEFQMELNPRELGRIDVKMIVESGKLSVEIVAQTPRTEQLLRSSLDGLTDSLRTVSSQELSSVQVVGSANSTETQFGAAFAMNQHNPDTAQQQADANSKTSGRRIGGVSAEAADTAQQEGNTPQRLLDYAV